MGNDKGRTTDLLETPPMNIDIPISEKFLKTLREDAASQGLRLDSYLVSIIHSYYKVLDVIDDQLSESQRPRQFHPLARGEWQPIDERLGATKLRRVK